MRPITIDKEEREALLKEFEEALSKSMFQGTFSFTKKYTFNGKDKAHIYYTPSAFAKTVMLLKNFESEVAWYCLADRGEEDNEFIVFDVLVYPQSVTGATVEADEAATAKFMRDLTDEQAEHLFCQCHSHVNMGTTPSSTDLTHQSGIVDSMNGQGFYIFQIWNKRLETSNFIYDFDNNVYWENADIDIEIIDEEWGDLSYFIHDAKKIVTVKSGYVSSYNQKGNTTATNKKEKKEKDKQKQSSYNYYDSDDDEYYENGWNSGYYYS